MPAQRRFNVREACMLPVEQRSEEHIDDMADFVKNVKFFQKLSSVHQRALCRRMTIETFGRDEYIFHVGDIGDKFYVIFSGSVSVQIPRCPNHRSTEICNCKEKVLEIAIHLKKGTGFGELALQNNGEPRSAAIQAVERTEVLVITRDDYDEFAGQRHKQFIQQRVNFLRQCPHIEDALLSNQMTLQDLAAMADCLNEASHSGNEMAFQQGEPVEHIIFVRSGHLAMLRTVDPATSKHSLVQEADAQQAGASGANKEFRDDQDQQLQLTHNLAKAMCEIRAKDRKKQLAALLPVDKGGGQQAEAAAAPTPTTLPSKPGGSQVPPPPTVPTSVGASRLVKGARFSDRDDARRSTPPDGASNAQGAKQSPQQRGRKSTAAPEAQQELPQPEQQSKWQKIATSRRLAQIVTSTIQAFEKAAPTPPGSKETPRARGAPQSSRDTQARQRSPEARQLDRLREKIASSRGSITHAPIPELPKSARTTTASWRSAISSSPARGSSSASRPRVLRVGAIGAFQYFGDHQLATGDVYPVSLVSDPVAELYLISKADILRRLPKRLVSSLFTFQKDTLPTDFQLLQMQRQTERWSAFRRSMHSEALSGRRGNWQESVREPTSKSRVDVAANLEFLGISPKGEVAKSLTLPSPRKVVLTSKDEELFSQVPARFLRNMETMKRDPGLRAALARDGLLRRPGQGDILRDDGMDANKFFFELQWSKLRRDPIELALSEDAVEEPLRSPTLPAATPTGRHGAAGRSSNWRPSRSSPHSSGGGNSHDFFA